MLVEALLALALEEDLVGLAVGLLEVDGRGNIEVVLESGYMKQDGMASLSCIC